MKRITSLVAALVILGAGVALAGAGNGPPQQCGCQEIRGPAPVGLTAGELSR